MKDQAQSERLNALQVRLDAAIDDKTQNFQYPLADLIKYLPEGDFEEIDSDWSDPWPASCGDDGCPVGWHKYFSCMDVKRRNGELTVAIQIGDEGGDWECYGEWKEGDEDEWEGSDVQQFMLQEGDHYFASWAEYWLACAESGKDPLGEYMGHENHDWAGWCMDAAEKNISYMERRLSCANT